MFTALISALTGLLSGVVPDIIKEVRDTRNHQRETEFLKLQNDLQIAREQAGADAKMREAEASMMAAEVGAFKETLAAILENQSKPTGIAWIDGLNAVIRPATCVLMMVLFFWTAAVFTTGVMDAWVSGKIANETVLATTIWNSMIGEAIQATLGFLFGYRSTRKLSRN